VKLDTDDPEQIRELKDCRASREYQIDSPQPRDDAGNLEHDPESGPPFPEKVMLEQ